MLRNDSLDGLDSTFNINIFVFWTGATWKEARQDAARAILAKLQ